MPVIAAMGTANPDHMIAQEAGRDFARRLFVQEFRDLERLLKVFTSAGIDSRYFCVPLEWFEKPHGWQEKNRLYQEAALDLACQAVQKCLDRGGMTAKEIDWLIFVSSTGLSTPSLDAHLINRLGMKLGVKRLPLWGLGCAGGAGGLARAYDLARAYPASRGLVVAVELCGLTFISEDRSKSNLIATSLFGDGGAAVLVLGDVAAEQLEAEGPRIQGVNSTLWPDTLEVMGWDIQDEGMKVIFSKDIPSLVAREAVPRVDNFLASHGLTRRDVGYFIPHPGGTKVLGAYEAALGFSPEQTAHSREVLRRFGNMSSPTVLFVLEQELADPHGRGEYGLVLALGPGFALEQVLLRW